MDRLGGRDAWGMTSVLSGRYHADPSALLERLFPAAVAVIDRTMAATPVERLSGVHLTAEHCEPSKRESSHNGSAQASCASLRSARRRPTRFSERPTRSPSPPASGGGVVAPRSASDAKAQASGAMRS